MSIPFLKAYNQKKLKAGFFVDRVFRVFGGKGDKKPGYHETPRKILVLQSHLIGDVMMAVPLLRALKRKYPEASVCLFANGFALDIMRGAWFVDKVYAAEFPWGVKDYRVKSLLKIFLAALSLRREGFDLVIDAQIDFRNAFLMFLTGARRRIGYDIVGGRTFLTDVPEFPDGVVHLLEGRLSLLNYMGIDTGDKSYERLVDMDSIRWAECFVFENGIAGRKIVAVHPGASVREKLWGAEKFARVIGYLDGAGFCPVLVEGPGDGPVVSGIKGFMKKDVITLKTGLKNLMAFFDVCSLVVCLDSAASHLASAVNTPAVVLYGPQWPHLAKPFDEQIVAVWKDGIDCRPCAYTECGKTVNRCMQDISVDDVITSIKRLLKINDNDEVMAR